MGKHSTNYIAGNVRVPPNVTMGKYNSIALDVFFHCDSEHPCIMNPKVVTSNSFYHTLMWHAFPKQANQGKIVIENDVWIATGAKILEGVTIHNGAIVASYSVVTKDVPPYALVAGNPARIKRFRFSQRIIDKLQKIQWWNWGMREVKQRLEDLQNIDEFIKKYGHSASSGHSE